MEISPLRLRYEQAFERLALFIRQNPNHPKIALVKQRLINIPRIIAAREATRR